ncbi:MAG: hypothetical protein HY744_27180 [Deltaproteobacteria bacterium]|nr:hypothetical protein [Deltaproteobacteria bacterium]
MSPAARDAFATWGLVAAVAAAAAAPRAERALGAPPSAEQCAELFDRHVALASRALDPRVPEATVGARRRQARERPGRVAAVARCRRELGAAEVECGLHATGLDELERCMP